MQISMCTKQKKWQQFILPEGRRMKLWIIACVTKIIQVCDKNMHRGKDQFVDTNWIIHTFIRQSLQQ